MLDWLTPAERRGAAILIGLLLIGTAWDAWRPQPRSRLREISQAGSAWDSRAVGEPSRWDSTSAAEAARSMTPGSLDLNRASAAELDALPGIGPVLAARIVEHRRRSGAYRRLEDLLAVRGVGPRLLDRLRPRVRIDAPGSRGSFPRGVQSAPDAPQELADSTSVPRGSAR